MSAQTYRKKPVTVEAIQWTGDNFAEIGKWMAASGSPVGMQGTKLTIPTLEGVMTASSGDFIIRGLQGEFYPCKPDIFAGTYELAYPPKPRYEVVGPATQPTKKGGREVLAKVGDLVRSNYSSSGAVWRVESVERWSSQLVVLRTRSLSSNRRGGQWGQDMEIVREVVSE